MSNNNLVNKSPLIDEQQLNKYRSELDCLDNFFECEIYIKYDKILNFAENNGFKRIFDIGCAYGHQSEMFLNSVVEYVGIDEIPCTHWNTEKYKYISKHYPFKIEAHSDDLAVSSLCLTWNCYLYEGNKTLKEQCEVLQRDFKSCLLYMQMDQLDFVKKYFKTYEVIDKDMVYFSN